MPEAAYWSFHWSHNHRQVNKLNKNTRQSKRIRMS